MPYVPAVHKEDQATSHTKTQLGWGDDNIEDYKKWRRHLKAYTLMNNITGRQGTSNTTWNAFKTFAMEAKHGLPTSGWILLNTSVGDKEGDKARDRFHHLLLDSLKKDHETDVKEDLASAARQQENAANNSDGNEERPIILLSVLVRVAIVNSNVAEDTNVASEYVWATARRKQFVALKNVTIMEVIKGIKDRILAGKHVRAIYGAITKPNADGSEPANLIWIISDADLTNFLTTTNGVYRPIMLQIELVRAGGAQPPPPDKWPYFTVANWATKEDPNDPLLSDSENNLYIMKFGKHKAKAWPRSDHGFEHKKAKIRKGIRHMQKHMKELKRRPWVFKGLVAEEIINSDNKEDFSWLKWLNPQDEKEYVRVRAAVVAGRQHYQQTNDEQAAEGVALAAFGP